MKEFKANFKKDVGNNKEQDLKASDLQKICQKEWQQLSKQDKQNFELRAQNEQNNMLQHLIDSTLPNGEGTTIPEKLDINIENSPRSEHNPKFANRRF